MIAQEESCMSPPHPHLLVSAAAAAPPHAPKAYVAAVGLPGAGRQWVWTGGGPTERLLLAHHDRHARRTVARRTCPAAQRPPGPATSWPEVAPVPSGSERPHAHRTRGDSGAAHRRAQSRNSPTQQGSDGPRGGRRRKRAGNGPVGSGDRAGCGGCGASGSCGARAPRRTPSAAQLAWRPCCKAAALRHAAG
jgi:hypothetical protein